MELINSNKNKLNSSKKKLNSKKKFFFDQYQMQPTTRCVILFSLYCSLFVTLYIIYRIV